MDLSQKLGTQAKKLPNKIKKTPEMYAELFDLTGQTELPVLLGAWYRLQFCLRLTALTHITLELRNTLQYKVLDECGSSTIKVDYSVFASYRLHYETGDKFVELQSSRTRTHPSQSQSYPKQRKPQIKWKKNICNINSIKIHLSQKQSKQTNKQTNKQNLMFC